MDKKFEFKDVDHEGMDTLSAIESAVTFNRWMYDTIRPYCNGKVLEIGSGIGNISTFFIKDGYDVTLSDIRDNYCEILKEKFETSGSNNEVLNLNLVDQNFDVKYQNLFGTFNTLFALNVVEHIENDSLAILNSKKLLKLGGKLIILVPAYPFLYNRFDTELEHYRRYTKGTLKKLFLDNGLKVIHEQHFNLMGIPGWYLSGKIQGNKTIPKNQMALYNKLVPLFKIIDKITLNKIGLSVVAVGENL